jgi:hypothetical protein
MSSIFSLSERIVGQKGSAAHIIAGMTIIIVGVEPGQTLDSPLVVYVAIAIGAAVMISAFLMIIKQYERAVILRHGRCQMIIG